TTDPYLQSTGTPNRGLDHEMSKRRRRGRPSVPAARTAGAGGASRTPPAGAPLRVGVIGAGRVGAVFGAALEAAGHRVVAVSAVSSASVARRAALLPGAAVRRPDHVGDGVDLLLLAVPDDTLAGLVHGLAEAGAISPGQIVAH